jgi:hypothetical protein
MELDNKDAASKANFVQFAYNMFQEEVLQPPPDPGIKQAGYDLLYYLNALDIDTMQFYGYLAASTTKPGDLILAIRGTEDFREWLLDFAALPVPFTPQPDAGFVALGFESIFDSFEFIDKSTGASSDLTSTITGLNAANPIQSLTVIGHSLGGALATLAAAQLALQNTAGVQNKMSIYTFASPRVGLLDFASSFNNAVQTSFRIWNVLDIVPEFPTFPYIHVSGFGDGIIQSWDQLTTLTLTPACEHYLTSYMWLLDAADFALPADCSNAAQQLALAAFAAAPDRVGIHAAGVQAMRKALAGH